VQKSFAFTNHRGHHHHDDHSSEHPRGGAPAEYAEPLVELTRSGLAESLHRGAVVVCGPDGQRINGLGHPAMPTFLRSAAKPLQALPLLTSGAAIRYGLTPAEIACMCGSLNGEQFQVEAVLSIMDKAELSPELLACGVHPPSHRPTAQAMMEQGLKPTALQNNCAGKHAAMLVLCAHLGHDPEGYTLPKHPVQRIILESVAALCNYPAEQIGIGIDGCGAPVFRLPLISLAGAYARLAAPEDAGLEPEMVAAIEEMMAACLAHPEMIAGTGRLCTRVMQAAPGQVLAKTGSEGSYALALPGQKLGVAIQIEDGAMRALPPAVTQILHSLGLLGHDALDGELRDLFHPVRKNHLGQEVTGLKAVFHL
jgi:L-asparaginase II